MAPDFGSAVSQADLQAEVGAVERRQFGARWATTALLEPVPAAAWARVVSANGFHGR